jgi:molybdenum cofactor cytidylyltransferase
MRGITGILLAAGRSRRFGANKLLAALPDGTPLVCAAVRRLRAVLDTVIVVVHPQDKVVPALLAAETVQIVVCQNADAGMGASLAAGVAASGAARGWLIALADMPAIQTSTLQQVAQALVNGAALVAPFHSGRRGHPVAFHSRFRDELLALSGDTGARELLARHAAALTRLDVDDPGILFDVDTPGDLEVDVALAQWDPATPAPTS